MILRIAAALALAFGIALTLAYLHVAGKGPFATPAMRHLRAMKDRTEEPARVEDATFASMAALPRGLSVAEYSGIERRAVRFECYLQRVVRSADHDLHLELNADPKGPEDPNTPYVTGEITPQWRGASRGWSYDGLLECFRPNWGGVTAWDGGPTRVRVTGWLLYDYEHEGQPPWGPPRVTQWEIHPITRIERWDGERMAYVEQAR